MFSVQIFICDFVPDDFKDLNESCVCGLLCCEADTLCFLQTVFIPASVDL